MTKVLIRLVGRDRLERWLLLDQSGELDAVRRRLLSSARRADSSLILFERDLQELVQAVRSLPVDLPDARELADRLRASEPEHRQVDLQDLRQPPAPFSVAAWRWAALGTAALAVLTLILGGLELRFEQPKTYPPEELNPLLAWDDGFEAAVEDFLMSMAVVEWDESETSLHQNNKKGFHEAVGTEDNSI